MAVDRARSPGEVQDRALVAFEIVLGSSGWRVGHFRVETIIEDLTQVKDDLGPRLAVLAATTSERFAEVAPQLSLSSAWRPCPCQRGCDGEPCPQHRCASTHSTRSPQPNTSHLVR
jgi:hypothetical protein